MTDLSKIEGAVEAQGKAFEEFKSVFETELGSKIGKDDPLVTEKLAKIESALDTAAETKASLESAIAAEVKEREELEARINRNGIQANSEEEAKAELALREFNLELEGRASERKRSFTPLDMDGFNAYKSAQDKWLRYGKEELSAEEVKTLSTGVDSEGGYLVTPDTSGRMATKIYETSPIRQIANVQPISTDKLEGIEDLDEGGAGYAGEKSTGGDTTTAGVGEWSIQVFNIDTEPKATQNLLDDAMFNVEAWLATKAGAKIGRFENAEFVAGSTGKILGFAGGYDTSLDAGSGVDWGKIGYAVTGKSAAFKDTNPADVLFDLIGLLKGEYLQNARFVTRRAVITAIRKLKDGSGQWLWQPGLQAGQPEVLAGYPLTRAEDMPAIAADSLSMAFGDFREAYQIVDRQGVRVLRDPYTGKPYVKFYTTKRTGGGVVNYEGVKLLKFGTS